LNKYIVSPPPDICAEGMILLGGPKDYVCVSLMELNPPAYLNAQVYCPMYGLFMGYMGWYWEKNIRNYECPPHMLRIGPSPLDFNHPYNNSKLYEFCLYKPNVNSLTGLWGYCYFFPERGVGYGFEWPPKINK